MVILNKRLIEKQGLDNDDIRELTHLHETKDQLFEFMEKLDPVKDQKQLQLYGKLMVSLEYDMQRVWKFDQNEAYHSWWYQVPHCKCPKLDNNDPLYPYKIFHCNCPIHGGVN